MVCNRGKHAFCRTIPDRVFGCFYGKTHSASVTEAAAAAESCYYAFGSLAQSFDDLDVFSSHGNHIKAELRDAATVLYWFPEILTDARLLHGFPSRIEEEKYWSSKNKLVDVVLAYIAGQVQVFDWPTNDDGVRQYEVLYVGPSLRGCL